MGTYFDAMKRQAAPDQDLGVTQQQIDATFAAMQAAKTADLASVNDDMGAYYASAFTEDQLRQLIAFLSSPAGKAWTAHQMDRSNALGRSGARLINRIENDAGRQICPTCSSSPPPSAAPSPR